MKNSNKIIMSLMVVFGFIFMAGICSSYVIGKTTTTPEMVSIDKGDSFTIKVYSSLGHMDIDNIKIEITKVDDLDLYDVYWTHTITLSLNDSVATVVIRTLDDSESGVYTINIYSVGDNYPFDSYATLTIREIPTLNWVAMFALMFVGVTFIAVGAVGYSHVKKTKTLADDIALGMVIVAGVAFIVMAIALYFGYIVF